MLQKRNSYHIGLTCHQCSQTNEALDEAQDRLIIVGPWLSEYAIDTELMEKEVLNR